MKISRFQILAHCYLNVWQKHIFVSSVRVQNQLHIESQYLSKDLL